MPKRKLPLRPSTNKPAELQSMRKGGKNQVWGKGCFNKSVIIATLKEQLRIGRGQDKDTIASVGSRRLCRFTCRPERMKRASALMNMLLRGHGLAVSALGE